MTIQDLLDAYYLSRKNNRRSKDQIDFEKDLYARLTKLLDDINNRCYQYSGCYSFIHYRPKPREVFAASVELKIMLCYIDSRIRSIIEKTLIDRTYNNRKGMGTLAAIKLVYSDIKEVSENYTKPCYIVKWDLQGFFPNINQLIAFDMLMDLLKKEYHGDDWDDLEYCIRINCFANPQFHAVKRAKLEEWELISDYKSLYSKPWGTGAAIGFLFWQIMTNYYLHELDNWYVTEIEPHYIRFVDDFVVVTTNLPKVLNALEEVRKRLHDIGVSLHPKKFYCQPFQHGLEFLGYHIRPGRVILNNKVVNRARHAALFKGNLNHYICKINSYLGMLKIGTNLKVISEILHSIHRPDVEIDYFEKVVKKKVIQKVDKKSLKSNKIKKKYKRTSYYLRIRNRYISKLQSCLKGNKIIFYYGN